MTMTGAAVARRVVKAKRPTVIHRDSSTIRIQWQPTPDSAPNRWGFADGIPLPRCESAAARVIARLW